MITLILIRGLPGSGKTTLAKSLSRYETCSHYCPNNTIDPENWCLLNTKEFLKFARLSGKNESIIVHNTFPTFWEMKEFTSLQFDKLFVIDLYDNGLSDQELFERCTHDTPFSNLSLLRRRWEHDWRPRPCPHTSSPEIWNTP